MEEMESIKDLIQQSCGLLRKTSIEGRSFKRPHYPTVVIYFGENAARFHSKIKSDMANGWGNNANYIRYLVMTKPDKKSLYDADSGEMVTETNAGEQMDGLLLEKNIAESKSRIALYCFIDTTSISQAGEFKKWYKAIDCIRELFPRAKGNFFSMLIVMLNQSHQYTREPAMIKRELLEVYKDGNGEYGMANRHMYNSVYIVSNLLKDNTMDLMDPDSSEFENFYLLSDLILLANTDDGDYINRLPVIYNESCPAFTVAYGHKEKPVQEITVVIMKVMLEKLEKRFGGYSLSEDGKELKDALEIERNTTSSINDINDEIKSGLLGTEFIAWLPKQADSTESRRINFHNARYGEADEASCGCLDFFVRRNHLAYVDSEMAKRDYIEDQIVELLQGKLNAAYYQAGVNSIIMNNVLGAIDKAGMLFKTEYISQAIDTLVEMRIADLMKEKYRSAITTVENRAKETSEIFNIIKKDFDQTAAVGDSGTNQYLENHYTKIADRFFNDEKRTAKLFEKIMMIGNTKAQMLEILFSELEVLFSSDPIFKAPFVDELSTRLAEADKASRNKAAQIIKRELYEGMDDKIRLHTAHGFNDRVYEVYLINANDDAIRQSLESGDKKDGIPKTYFNTMNNNMAESIWFYACSEENLSM